MNSVGLALIDDVAPAGTAAEAMPGLGAAYQGGLAIGTALAGATSTAGTTTVFLVAFGFAALAALIAWPASSLRPLARPAARSTA